MATSKEAVLRKMYTTRGRHKRKDRWVLHERPWYPMLSALSMRVWVVESRFHSQESVKAPQQLRVLEQRGPQGQQQVQLHLFCPTLCVVGACRNIDTQPIMSQNAFKEVTEQHGQQVDACCPM